MFSRPAAAVLNQRLHAVMKLCRSNAAFSTSIDCLKSDKDPHVGRKQNPDVKLIRLSEAFEKLSEPNLAQAQHDFLIGSKQAFLTVTSLLSQGHYDNLHGLVHTHCLELMKKRVESLSKREKARREPSLRAVRVYMSRMDRPRLFLTMLERLGDLE